MSTSPPVDPSDLSLADLVTGSTPESGVESPLPEDLILDSVVTLPGEVPVFSPETGQIVEYVRKVEFRPAMGWEDDLFRTKTGGPKEKLFRLSKILSMCTVRMGGKFRENPGEDHDKGHPEMFLKEWEAALSPIRMAALLRLRQVSVGHHFKFTGVCPLCKKPTPNLSYDLRDCEEKAVLLKRTGDSWEQTTKVGRWTVKWSPLLASEEYMMSEVQRKQDDDSSLFLLFVKKVDGATPTVRTFQRFTNPERAQLRELLQFGGVNTTVLNTCTNKLCGVEYPSPLPVLLPSFFSQ